MDPKAFAIELASPDPGRPEGVVSAGRAEGVVIAGRAEGVVSAGGAGLSQPLASVEIFSLKVVLPPPTMSIFSKIATNSASKSAKFRKWF